jgi:Leucine-rich repeat (LRR) protein
MKKNDLILLSSLASYSYLFYNQSPGINFFLLTIILILLLQARDGIYKNIFNLSYWLSIAGSIVSAACVVLYGNTLSSLANILSLSLVAAFSVEKSSSLIFAGLYSLYSYISAIAMMFIDWTAKQKKKSLEGKKSGLKLFLFLIPIIISFIFFFLYREANPLFKNFTSTISFDFITWSWVRFTLLGFVLLYGFFYHRRISLLTEKDLKAQNNLSPANFSSEKNTLLGFNVDLSNEFMSGVILFSLLNILLLFVNVLDFQYLWLTNSLPEGLNFSESVHQGIGTLITSIILAVLIILVYFRGNINFYSSGRTIKVLAYIWVLQNAFMILSTVMRNQLYINEYSLTYKRIGVYVYLLLCLIGLFTTIIKIASAKSNWYLFRSNSWLFYGVLIISCVINWDRMISEFNLLNSKTLDRDYLIRLSSSNTDQLLASSHLGIDSMETSAVTLNNLHRKTYYFLSSYQKKEWKSWNREDEMIYNNILALEKNKKILSLNLSNSTIASLTPISGFRNLKKLDLTNNWFKALPELKSFPLLEALDLSGNGIDSIQKIPVNATLRDLNLSNNRIQDYYALANLQGLESLNISNNKTRTLNSLPSLPKLKSLDISQNNPGHLFILQRFPSLTVFKMNYISPVFIATLPPLTNLKELELDHTDISCPDEKAINCISTLTGLNRLRLSSNRIQNIYLANQELFDFDKKAEKLADLKGYIPTSVKELDLSSNQIQYSDGLERLPDLITLDISNNGLKEILSVAYCNRLEKLSLGSNAVEKINSLSTLVNLKSLSLENNKIIDLKALDNLIQLNYLNLSGNSIEDITALGKLTNVTELFLNDNINLSSLASLKNMTKLEVLNISNTQVIDLSPLYELKNLKALYCSGIQQVKLDELKRRLPNLEINKTNNNNYEYDTAVPVNY